MPGKALMGSARVRSTSSVGETLDRIQGLGNEVEGELFGLLDD